MKLSTYMYLTAFVLSSCLAVVAIATTKTTTPTTEATTPPTKAANTSPGGSSTVTTIAPPTSTNVTSETNHSTNASSTSVSSFPSTSHTNNSTDTSRTTQPSTMVTTQSPVLCKNGTCSGNDSCMNNITETCALTGSQSCYQIVHTNETYMSYEVGCKTSCEYLVQDTQDETRTTRCCNTDLCNMKLLPDPDPDNDAVRSCLSTASLVLALLICSSLT